MMPSFLRVFGLGYPLHVMITTTLLSRAPLCRPHCDHINMDVFLRRIDASRIAAMEAKVRQLCSPGTTHDAPDNS